MAAAVMRTMPSCTPATATGDDVADVANPPGIGNVYGVVEVPSSTGSDDCATAPLITAYGTVPFSCVGAMSSSQPGCPMTNDVWFKYIACTNGSHTVTTCSLASFDTALQVLSGSCGALAVVGCNNDACGVQSSLTWNAIAGTTYYIRIGAFQGAPGSGFIELTGPGCYTCPSISVVQGPVVNPANGHTYYRLSPSSWSCAEIYAATHLGGHLVSINDAAENAFVYNTFANVPGSGPVWLGLTDYITAGAFVYTNGDPVAFTQWGPGQPDDAGGIRQQVCMYSGSGPFGNSNWV